jgi:hypothetical protein
MTVFFHTVINISHHLQILRCMSYSVVKYANLRAFVVLTRSQRFLPIFLLLNV